jgi:cytochrome c biogenesis protein CcmG, thiol:disulfide interchange protein DsbE
VPPDTVLGSRSPFSLIAVSLLCAAALGLSVLAVRSVFHTEATEVSFQPVTPAPRDQIGPDAGEVAPGFQIPAYDGSGTIRLDAFRGHPIVLNFWASWCPPCRAEAGILEDAHLQFQSQGVVFVGVDMQSDTWAESRAFLRRHGITYSVGRDERGVVGRAYRVTSLPTTFLITADGRVRSSALTGGFIGPHGAVDLAQEIEQLIH